MEDFVTFNQAVKLKRLGFDWKCNHVVDETGYIYEETTAPLGKSNYHDFNHEDIYDNMISVPTLTQVQKWFREVHGIDIDISSAYYKLDPDNIVMYSLHIGNRIPFQKEYYINYESYEQALSAGIDHAIKLLKK